MLAYFPYYTEFLGPGKDLPEYQPSTTYAHVSAESLLKTYAPQVQPDWRKICECVKQLKERVELDIRHQRQLLLYRKVSRWCTEFTDAGDSGWKSLSIPDSARWLHNHFPRETHRFSLRYVVKEGVDTLYKLVVVNELTEDSYVGLLNGDRFLSALTLAALAGADYVDHQSGICE